MPSSNVVQRLIVLATTLVEAHTWEASIEAYTLVFWWSASFTIPGWANAKVSRVSHVALCGGVSSTGTFQMAACLYSLAVRMRGRYIRRVTCIAPSCLPPHLSLNPRLPSFSFVSARNSILGGARPLFAPFFKRPSSRPVFTAMLPPMHLLDLISSRVKVHLRSSSREIAGHQLA